MPSWATVQSSGERAYRWSADQMGRILPRSRAAWGVMALVGAFVMLAIGAALSLRPSADGEGDDDKPTDPMPSDDGGGVERDTGEVGSNPP